MSVPPEALKALIRIALALEKIAELLAQIADQMPRESPLDRAARRMAEDLAKEDKQL
jgi:hypothetical protein